jgi:hypothetical protein
VSFVDLALVSVQAARLAIGQLEMTVAPSPENTGKSCVDAARGRGRRARCTRLAHGSPTDM